MIKMLITIKNINYYEKDIFFACRCLLGVFVYS